MRTRMYVLCQPCTGSRAEICFCLNFGIMIPPHDVLRSVLRCFEQLVPERHIIFAHNTRWSQITHLARIVRTATHFPSSKSTPPASRKVQMLLFHWRFNTLKPLQLMNFTRIIHSYVTEITEENVQFH